jgi:hypothetical protein
MDRRKGSSKKGKKGAAVALDYHEGLSPNQVAIILRELNLSSNEFNFWLGGQTCPFVERLDKSGKRVLLGGVYEYDLFRWIAFKRNGTPLLFD